MFKNRTLQLIYQTSYCTMALIGIVASSGFFDMTFYENFYLYFTNWSNYFCFGVMLVELLHTVKSKENDYVRSLPRLKFIGMLAILLTFLVFNLLLANEPTRNSALNYKVNSVFFHDVLPVMYIADWFLFYERRKTKWTYPIFSIIFPIIYMIFVFVRAGILTSVVHVKNIDVVLYPYFFFNLEKLGVAGVAKWCSILSVVFVVVGFVFVAADKFIKPKKA